MVRRVGRDFERHRARQRRRDFFGQLAFAEIQADFGLVRRGFAAGVVVHVGVDLLARIDPTAHAIREHGRRSADGPDREHVEEPAVASASHAPAAAREQHHVVCDFTVAWAHFDGAHPAFLGDVQRQFEIGEVVVARGRDLHFWAGRR
jgi:hypothetical protein